MVESQGQEVDEATMLRAFEFAHAIVREFIKAQKDFIALYHAAHPIKEQKLYVKSHNDELKNKIDTLITDERITELYRLGKSDFHTALVVLEDEIKASLGYTEDTEELTGQAIEEAVYKVLKKHMRKNVLSSGLRLDGRKADEVRPIRGTFGLLPRTHGSALFQRGITQALTITTLG